MYACMTGFMAQEVDALLRELIGFIAKEVDVLRQEMIERVDHLEQQLVGRVEDLSDDVKVLRDHYIDIQNEIAALCGKIVGRRLRG